MTKPEEITLKELLRLFSDKGENEKFCFILGAGASKPSGIPTGAELAEEWLKEIEEDIHQDEFEQWLKDKKIDKNNSAPHYSQIFTRRFKTGKRYGNAFLEKTMENAEPSCGYSFLAEIMAQGRHNVVITTNFDSLTEDALSIDNTKRPIVIGHSSLANFINRNLTQPLIIKVHHDLSFSPQNDSEETSKLDKELNKKLKEIFADYTPIVIGYGGNDGGFMTTLKENLEQPLFWCYKDKDKDSLSDEIKTLVAEKKGFLVRISGFDELMVTIGDTMNLGLFDERIKKITEKRIEKHLKQLEEVNKKINISTNSPIEREAIKGVAKRTESWLSYAILAQQESDTKRKEEIYQEGMEKFPESHELMGNYAIFLTDIKKDHTKAEVHYKKALALEPDDADYNGNYANFLKNIKKDYSEAEAYYKKALALEPNHAVINNNYANFLTDIKKDHTKAEVHYKKALALEPDDATINGSYAIFLCNIKKDYTKAEVHYKKALALEPDDADYNGNYANFLKNIKKDYSEAEAYYKKALELEPNHAVINNNYANFLTDIKKDHTKAEVHYKKALALEPNHAVINNNYASFLTDIKKDHTKAEVHYKKALALEPDDATINGSYANFLTDIKKDHTKAEVHYKKALALEPDDATINGSYANFLTDIKKDHTKAEVHYKKALALEPDDATINGSYANFLTDIKKDHTKAEVHYKKALALEPDDATINGSYAIFLCNIKKDYTKAEVHYKKALALEPDDATINGSYAIFLCNIKKDYTKAEEYYKKALELEPDNANINGNYANFLLEQGQLTKARGFIDNAFKLFDDSSDEIAIKLELWFYRYACFYENYPESKQIVADLLNADIRSPHWDLSRLVEKVKELGHPEYEQVASFARQISEDLPPQQQNSPV